MDRQEIVGIGINATYDEDDFESIQGPYIDLGNCRISIRSNKIYLRHEVLKGGDNKRSFITISGDDGNTTADYFMNWVDYDIKNSKPYNQIIIAESGMDIASIVTNNGKNVASIKDKLAELIMLDMINPGKYNEITVQDFSSSCVKILVYADFEYAPNFIYKQESGKKEYNVHIYSFKDWTEQEIKKLIDLNEKRQSVIR